MKAELIVRRRVGLSEDGFVEIVVWRVPTPVRGSSHGYKYRLAYVEGEECVVRYDNEAGKGDHRHVGTREFAYRFVDLETLLADFEEDVLRWKR